MPLKYLFAVIGLFWVNVMVDIYGALKVCVTTSLIGDLVAKAGGSYVEVETLMGPGVDPHLYRATKSDLEKLRNADVIFYNGLHLEGRMTEVFEGLASQGKAVFAVSDGIDRQYLLALPGKGGYDPHVWFDPRLWAQCLDKVVEVLKKKDPLNAEAYALKGGEFNKELQALMDWGNVLAKPLEPQRRVLITSHDAYNYFGKAFGFQVIGVQGISTISEAGLADIMSTVDFIKKHEVKAIFVESSVSPAAIERISKDSGVRIGGSLFSDSLGAVGEKMDGYEVWHYVGMFKYNMETIVKGLR